MTDQPHPLEYRAEPRRRRRWGLLIVAACVFAGIVLAYQNRYQLDQYRQRFEQMRRDQKMMNYQPPAGQVVFDDTAGAAVIGPPPLLPLPTSNATLVFEHGRKTVGGQEALVVIQVVPPRSGHGEHLAVTIYEPATMHGSTRHHGPGVAWEAPPIVGAASKKIFAGTHDPKDESHFTIDYIVNGQKRTLEGWLVDIPRDQSGATVELKMSDGPAK